MTSINPDPDYDILIRPADRKDCEAVANLIKELADYEKMSDCAVLTGKDIERDAFDSNPPNVQVLVAESVNSKVIVGYVLYFYSYSMWKGKAIHMEDIYVKPEHRFKKIGESMLKRLAKIADAGNYARISFECIDWNEPAMKFYRKHGAEDVTVTEHWHSLRFENSVMKSLASD